MIYYKDPDYAKLWDLGNRQKNGLINGEEMVAYTKSLANSCPKPEGMIIEDRKIPGLNGAPEIRARIYKMNTFPENTPIYLDIHGGGWYGGELDYCTDRNVYFCEHTPCIVVSVDYRLAPQNPFPAALEDCYAALCWVHQHAQEMGGDPNKIAVGGISAGGNLSEGLALYVRDKGGPKITAVVLNQPVLTDEITTSGIQLANGAPMLDGFAHTMYQTLRMYLGDLNGQAPSYYAIPMRCANLAGLPPHILGIGEYDPLRDETIQYAQRLLWSSVPTELHVMPRVGHGFDLVQAPMTTRYHDMITASLRKELTVPYKD